ncbi:MAG TPA: hypothetical protein VIF08_04220, partial [Candidatus Limnocylindrales bacterium]
MSRLTRFVALSVIGVALVAGPAATTASAGVLDYGAIARCKYAVTQSHNGTWTEALLKRIVVRPPTLPAMTTMDSVGWRFVILRSLDRENTPYVITYRSPLQRAPRSADFTPMRHKLHVPAEADTPNGRSFVSYQVMLKFYWYKADGSLFTSAVYTMQNMDLVIAGE